MCTNEYEKEQCSILEMLINWGVDLNTANNFGLTPMCLAAEVNNIHVIETLVQHGCNVNCIIAGGAFDKGTALHVAAATSDIETIKTLIKHGGDIYIRDWRGRIPVHWSAKEGKLSVMKHIIQLMDGDMLVHDNEGSTLLHLAAIGGNVDTTKWLLNKEHNIEVKTTSGWTPLHCAANFGNSNIIHLLLDHNANINAQTYQGGTPLHFAALRGEVPAVKALLERGAKVNAMDWNNWTPLRMAVINQHNSVIDFLQSNGGNFGTTPVNRTPQLPGIFF